ncbi:MAG: phosphoribosylamine--glycine ligase [Phycisphaeraceae bacterium]|nr:MAG: phosphoribosylamine--glycine ligase [Phycisphaeraceae bacterium]
MTCPDRVNVFLVGAGGREHALARAIARSPRLGELWVDPAANPGIASLGRRADVPMDSKQHYRVRQFCDRRDIGLVVIGPEDPLAQGLADSLAERADGSRRAVLGPPARAARLEADKAYAKKLMRDASIPTAEGRSFDDYAAAKAFLESRTELHVIKAAGLAKGKGVVVPKTECEGLAALERMMVGLEFGDAGRRVVIEELMTGPEVSVLALVDGRNIMILPPCQDHKRLGDDDTGPNTGGMGAFCPSNTLDVATMSRVEREVFVPIVDALRRDEAEFRGVLYAGLMLTPAGPKVLEFNVRFGDPECQPLMARLESDAIELFHACATGSLHRVDVQWSEQHAVTVVLAAQGYPAKPRKGDEITGIEAAERIEGVRVDQAGTAMVDGKLVTSGGRVLGVTAMGTSFAEARERAYRAAGLIEFDGKQMRADIGASATAKAGA